MRVLYQTWQVLNRGQGGEMALAGPRGLCACGAAMRLRAREGGPTGPRAQRPIGRGFLRLRGAGGAPAALACACGAGFAPAARAMRLRARAMRLRAQEGGPAGPRGVSRPRARERCPDLRAGVRHFSFQLKRKVTKRNSVIEADRWASTPSLCYKRSPRGLVWYSLHACGARLGRTAAPRLLTCSCARDGMQAWWPCGALDWFAAPAGAGGNAILAVLPRASWA